MSSVKQYFLGTEKRMHILQQKVTSVHQHVEYPFCVTYCHVLWGI